MVSGSAPESFSTLRFGLWQLEPQQGHGVSEIELASVAVLQLELVECFHRLADEKRPALRVERTIGAEKHLIGTEEVEPAANAARPAVDRRVVVEQLEIIDRPLFHALAQSLVVLVGSARAELIRGVADAIGENGDHGTHGVG